MVLHGVNIPEREIAELCERHGIARLALFGSILSDEFGPESDVDVLVSFCPGKRIGLLGFVRIAGELEVLIGRPVDLREAEDLSVHFREDVVRTARLIHAA